MDRCDALGMKKRYYFDYNIYEMLRKGEIQIEEELFKSNDIFLSVSHIEEYYKAYCNDVNHENTEKLQRLREIMIEISKRRTILNPQKRGRIIAKSQTFDDCLSIIQKYDTRDIIDEHAQINYEYERNQVKLLREKDHNSTHNSILDRKTIWERPEVIEGIAKFTDFYQDYEKRVKSSLYRIYGPYVASQLVTKLPADFRLEKFFFKNKTLDFRLLECVIEYLHMLLGECGYRRDKDLRKRQSGIHDVSHSIYATYCDYFISNDKNFRIRTEAIYYYLGIDTEVLSPSEVFYSK